MLNKFTFLICLLYSFNSVVFASGSFRKDKISLIRADDENITIEVTGSTSGLYVLELRSYEKYDLDSIDSSRVHCLDNSGKIKRYHADRDLIYSQYYLMDKEYHLIAGPKYVSDTSAISARNKPLLAPPSVKGLTCIVDIDDAVELGVKKVNENILISDLIDSSNTSDFFYEFEDIKIPLNKAAIEKCDRRIKKFYDNGIGVSIVFLNKMPNKRVGTDPIIHPNSDVEGSPTHIGAFNIIEPLGQKYYLGALEFLVERYTRDDAKYGQIFMLIIGNELQQHWTWYNMGAVPADCVLDEYVPTVRFAWLASQKYHKDLKIYISMEHHWTAERTGVSLHEMRGDYLLEGFVQRCTQQGDFPWNVAFHPYPEDLFEPRFWRDKSPTEDFLTPRITFKNLDVLPRFMKQSHMLYQGHARDIALTEQGFHTIDGPDGEKIQAAAYAYSYQKVQKIPEITSYMLHRHVDHREEGGLRLGLWTSDSNAVSPEFPLRKKYIWDVFKYADTPQRERYFEFAKPILGIKDWSDTPTDTGPLIRSAFTVDKHSIIYDFIAEFNRAENVNNLQCEPKDILRAAGWLVPAIFQHPPAEGTGRLVYQVKLPQVPQEGKLRLLFETMLANNSDDGVRFSISIDGEEIWMAVGIENAPVGYDLDLTEWSGRKVRIGFTVDKISNADYDWSYWINPIITNK